MPTIKQVRLVQAITQGATTLKEAGDIAGYQSKQIYRESTKKHLQESLGTSPKKILEEYEKLFQSCLTDKDKSIAKSILDSLAKINSMMIDKSVNLNVEVTEDLSGELSKLRQSLDGIIDVKRIDSIDIPSITYSDSQTGKID